MHEVEVRESPIEGLGVFAVSAIRAGELIREYNLLREVTPETPVDPSNGEAIEHCTYPGSRVFLVGHPDRHFNHSCDPNAVKRFSGDAIQLFSRRDIAPDEEITHDYLINTHRGSRWPCHCQAARCRGEAVPSFFDLPRSIQIEYVPYLAPWFIEQHSQKVARLKEEARGQEAGSAERPGR